MPWRGPSVPGEFPTLGYEAGEWIEAFCVVPDGPLAGEPYRLTDEMWRFLLWFYRVRVGAIVDKHAPSSAFAYRRAQLVRPQKWGKGPLSAAIICAEAAGPVLFDGWDAAGEPVGRPWDTPWIQVTAASEGQTDNVWRALQPMIEMGPLADFIPDTGITRINLPTGRPIEPVTSSAKSRLGQPITFAVQDETHSWLQVNGGHRLADNQRRNLAGTGGRSIETTNCWDPAELSTAQQTAEANVADVYRDHPPSPPGSVHNKRERRRVLRAVYGNSFWVDLDRIENEIEELIGRGEDAQAERFFLNRVSAEADQWMDGELWDSRVEPRGLHRKARICLGFDGSDVDDWTVIRGETLDGYQFTPAFVDGKPMVWNPADHGGQVPRLEVDAAMSYLFSHFEVVRLYADPPDWKTEIDGWSEKFGEKKVVRFETYRTAQMAAALGRLHTDIAAGTLEHDGCPITAVHMRNAKKERRQMGGKTVVIIRKDRPGSPRKIDAAMSSALVHEAAGDAIAAGERTRKLKTGYVYTD